MSDPRNDAHDKKVAHEKKKQESAEQAPAVADTATLTEIPTAQTSAGLEGSLAVLAQLKELEFHSRGAIERLAALALTVEDALKQKAFAAPLAEVYAAQSAVQTALTTVIEDYTTECARLQG